MIWFCKHIWKEKERFNVVRHYTYTGAVDNNCLLLILECVKCGKLKKMNIP